MKVLELKAKLKTEIKNLYIISGNDSFLISVAVNTLKEKLVDAFEEFNFVKMDATELKDNDYKNILNTLPFGAPNRLIVLENVNAVGVKALETFNSLPFYNVVVAVISPNDKITGEVINCDHLIGSDLKKWLVNYLTQNKLVADDKVLDYIINISNGDLTYLNSELNKVVGYCQGKEPVTVDIVKMLFTKNENYFVYNLTSAIDKKDKATAMKILNSLQENVSVGDIFTFMGSNFRKMFYCAVNAKNDENLAVILKTKPYAIQKARESVTRNGKSFYIDLYNKYVNLDFDIKSGKISPINAIYSLVLL